MSSPYRGRFAPSSTGQAHPGTLLAGLLAWLDARAQGGQILLRLEDLDPQRCKPEFSQGLQQDLAWLGLDWDAVQVQSQHAEAHAAALDALAAQGRLYACQCSRQTLRSHGRRAPDGSFAYPNSCRPRTVQPAQWRTCTEPLRVRLPDGPVQPRDLGGRLLAQSPAQILGDPVVRRRDTAVAYQLAVVVDDAAWGVTHIVRGHDIAPSTATQVALGQLLGYLTPVYRHHLLLCEAHGNKLAKLHGSVGTAVLRQHLTGPQVCGFLAHAVGLQADAAPTTPAALLPGFSWARVRTTDRLVRWDGRRLVAG